VGVLAVAKFRSSLEAEVIVDGRCLSSRLDLRRRTRTRRRVVGRGMGKGCSREPTAGGVAQSSVLFQFVRTAHILPRHDDAHACMVSSPRRAPWSPANVNHFDRGLRVERIEVCTRQGRLTRSLAVRCLLGGPREKSARMARGSGDAGSLLVPRASRVHGNLRDPGGDTGFRERSEVPPLDMSSNRAS